MEDDVRAAAARDIHRKSEVQLQSGHRHSEVQLQSGAATVDLTEVDTNTAAGQVPPCPAMAADLAPSITWAQRSQSSTTLTSESDLEASSASARLVDPYEDPLVQCISAIGAALSQPSKMAESDLILQRLCRSSTAVR